MSIAYRNALKEAKRSGKKHLSPVKFVKVRCTLEEKKTKQAESDACDINKIMARYINTGRLPEYIKTNASYGDFSKVEDYQKSLNTVIKAREQFDLLPSAVRDRCKNDPAIFLDFVSDPKNREELVKMRLAKPKESTGMDLTDTAISRLAEGISGALTKTPSAQAPSAATVPNKASEEA